MHPPRRNMGGRAAAAVLAGIALLGLAVRLYRLDQVSYDVDEYLFFRWINAPSVGEFLRSFHFWAPDNVDPFFAVRHMAAQLFDNPERGMRLLSTTFGVGGILLVYTVGARAFDRRAGLVAAWCFALSPMQWWFAQSWRSSTFSNLAALASLYALLRLLETPRARGWLAALALVNLALVWTHPMLGPFVAAEFIFLALLGLRRDRAPLWTAAALNGAVMATVLPVLLRQGKSMWQPADDFQMRLPSWKGVFYDLFGDDAAMSADPFLFQGPSWRFLRDWAQEALLSSHRWLDPALALFFVAVAAAALFSAVRGWRGILRGADVARHRVEGVTLLLAVAFLPFLMLAVLSLGWRPMLLPRYTLYSAVALHVLAGGMVIRLNNRCLRTVCVAIPVLLYAAQAALVLPMNTRSPFREVGEFLRLNASPSDLVVVRGNPVSWEMFGVCAPECPAPHVPAYSLRVAAERAARFLNASFPDSNPSVWVLVEPFVYSLPPPEQFTGALDAM
ncbi:MAG TPA: glycosyltransferase family 39 protein, partial [Candidatus Hydrogenedentes bacterium]|nr:glycosyltransferase family 39 protein [Candidatus Hydrogenedentota bacterium]